MVTINTALEKIYSISKNINKIEIPLNDSLGYVLAKDYIVKINIPRFDNSAMDGFAVQITNNKKLKISGTIYAGDKNRFKLSSETAVKIMTGGQIPHNTEAIIPIENIIKIEDDNISIPDNIIKYSNIRREGEDLKVGENLAEKGIVINSFHISIFASQGVKFLEVFEKPKIALLTTGDELKEYFEKIEDYQLYNSSKPLFESRIKELNAEIISIKNIEDNLTSIQNTIKYLLKSKVDLIITLGGASVGEKDYINQILLNLNIQNIFYKIDIKPGKPTKLSQIDETFIMNLPGNPLASIINFEIFTKPLIFILQGRKKIYNQMIETIIYEDLDIKNKKYSVVVGNWNGKYFKTIKKQSPNMISTLIEMNSILILNPKINSLKKNSLIKIFLIRSNLFSEKREDIIN